MTSNHRDNDITSYKPSLSDVTSKIWFQHVTDELDVYSVFLKEKGRAFLDPILSETFVINSYFYVYLVRMSSLTQTQRDTFITIES